MEIRRDEELIMRIKHRNTADYVRMFAMGIADQTTNCFAVFVCHAIFCGDRQRLNNTGASLILIGAQDPDSDSG